VTKIKGKTQTDQSIIKICGYITDDKFIASYLGVDLKRVAYLRRHVDQAQAKRDQAYERQEVYGKWYNDAERKQTNDAKDGSAKLLQALNAFAVNRQARINEGQAA
jgi:hypothetical protein